MSVFADTSAIYALLNRADEAHPAASAAFRELLDAGERLLTHNYVVVEAIALAQRRLGPDAVAALRDELLPILRQTWVDRELHELALAATIAAGSREPSLVDRVSFELMRRQGIRRVFAFDDDFEQQGFEPVPG